MFTNIFEGEPAICISSHAHRDELQEQKYLNGWLSWNANRGHASKFFVEIAQHIFFANFVQGLAEQGIERYQLVTFKKVDSIIFAKNKLRDSAETSKQKLFLP